MFGFERFFGPKVDAAEKQEEESGVETRENDAYSLVGPFSRLVPAVNFTAENIKEIVRLAKLTDDEVSAVLDGAFDGTIEDNDELDSIRERVIVAAKMHKDGIRE